jgi:hypothetical protein
VDGTPVEDDRHDKETLELDEMIMMIRWLVQPTQVS